jgi:hypothetical protein
MPVCLSPNAMLSPSDTCRNANAVCLSAVNADADTCLSVCHQCDACLVCLVCLSVCLCLTVQPAHICLLLIWVCVCSCVCVCLSLWCVRACANSLLAASTDLSPETLLPILGASSSESGGLQVEGRRVASGELARHACAMRAACEPRLRGGRARCLPLRCRTAGCPNTCAWAALGPCSP